MVISPSSYCILSLFVGMVVPIGEFKHLVILRTHAVVGTFKLGFRILVSIWHYDMVTK